MKYIIMCGGCYKKWRVPRQLLKYNGEPIVARTIRLLQDAGVTDIAISSNQPGFDKFGVPVLVHKNSYNARKYNDFDGYWCDAFYPTDEPTCYLFGDVIYSPAAIQTIVDYKTNDIMFFGSKRPFALAYPKDHVEPFAFKVENTAHLKIACEETKWLYEHDPDAFSRKPIAWELWYVICGAPTNQDAEHIVGADYVAINDYTCDIDYPSEARERSIK